jgi:hypothetical protein
MMDATQDKMVDPSERAYYMVPCKGSLSDGSPCTGYVFISLIDKTICPVCGTVYPNWQGYLARRTKDR